MPPNFAFHAQIVAALTPHSRATSSTVPPASTCFSAAMICASVCQLFSSRTPGLTPKSYPVLYGFRGAGHNTIGRSRMPRVPYGTQALARQAMSTYRRFETCVLNATNSRTMEILADWKPEFLDGTVEPINSASPKRRTVKVETQLDQLGPSTVGGVIAST